jgi:hypothetical protein
MYIKRMKASELAKKSHYSAEFLRTVLRGQNRPSKRYCKHIEEVTDGEVKASEVMFGFDEEAKFRLKNSKNKTQIDE